MRNEDPVQEIISHQQIMNTWAEFAKTHPDFWQYEHAVSISQWTDDAIRYLRQLKKTPKEN